MLLRVIKVGAFLPLLGSASGLSVGFKDLPPVPEPILSIIRLKCSSEVQQGIELRRRAVAN